MLVLITGGAGFIGSHLVDALLALSNRVIVFDDLSTGSKRNLAAHLTNPNLQIVRGSILGRAELESLLQGVDFVYHLAAAVGVNQIVGSPVRSIVTNSVGTHNILDLCAMLDIPVLFTSTSEVYGKSERAEFKEDDDLVLGATTRSRWSYAASKALDEWLALAYHHERGLRVHIVRLFNTVGPRQSGQYGMVIPRFVAQALAGQPLTVHGDGKQTRTFCHVRDVVPALVELHKRPELSGQVFNLGSTQEISILDLAAQVIKVTSSRSKIVKIPYDDAYDVGFEDMRRRRPCIEKAQQAIGFAPSVSLAEIIGDVAMSMRAESV